MLTPLQLDMAGDGSPLPNGRGAPMLPSQAVTSRSKNTAYPGLFPSTDVPGGKHCRGPFMASAR